MTSSRSKRPPRTSFLINFERSISNLNDFLWASLASYECALSYRPQSAQSAKDFLSPELSAHLNVSPRDFDILVASQEARLYRLILVEAVVFYEEYLGGIIKHSIAKSWITPETPAKISVKLTERDASSDIHKNARDKLAIHFSEKLVNSPYSKRHIEIDKALGIRSVSLAEHKTKHDHLILAGEFRNCIVHAGGITDERTIKNCSSIIPKLKLGEIIPLDRLLILTLLKELLNHACDIDLFIRRKGLAK